MDIIKVNNLTKKYGEFTAVNHISFNVKKGTLLGFLGVNGAGKTTVINMLATLLAPDEGETLICGKVLGKEDMEIRKKIGIVYQQNCLDDILTVRENLMCRGILHGAKKSEAKRQCVRLGEILKLDELMEKRYRTLSGGQKRRVEIAAALMHTPEILFLDEPTTGLDPATRVDVWNTVKELQEKEKMTVFLTTHYMEEAAGADQIIILDHGNIIATGTPFELKEKYATDRLQLYCKADSESREKIYERLGRQLEGKQILNDETVTKQTKTEQTGNVIPITIQKTLHALPIIENVKEYIDGFEVIQGNMDDVFLNAVGRKLEVEN